jgi:GTP cyclohydrolase I
MNVTWQDFSTIASRLGDQLLRKSTRYSGVYAIPRGGTPFASYLSGHLNVPLVSKDQIVGSVLICDDIIDSGATRDWFPLNDFVALVHRDHYALDREYIGNNGFVHYDKATHVMTMTGKRVAEWVSFPWEEEKQTEGEDLVRRMLQYIGEDPTRPGLIDTPKRVVKMWNEIFRAYKEPPPDITVFENESDGIQYDEMIRDSGYFYSYCEHHMQIFLGEYYFAYIPDKLVMGASKIGRTVNYYSSKLQVAERLVHEIADRVEKIVKPKGLMLIMDARHMCKECRGLKMFDSPFGVDVVRGCFKEPGNLCKAEFLSMISKGRR